MHWLMIFFMYRASIIHMVMSFSMPYNTLLMFLIFSGIFMYLACMVFFMYWTSMVQQSVSFNFLGGLKFWYTLLSYFYKEKVKNDNLSSFPWFWISLETSHLVSEMFAPLKISTNHMGVLKWIFYELFE